VFSSAGDALALALSSEHPVGMPSHRRDDRVRQEHGGSARHHRLLDRAQVGQGCTDRDKLLSCAPGSQFRSALTVATTPSRRRPDSLPTPSRTSGHSRAWRSLRRLGCATHRPRRSAATGRRALPKRPPAATPTPGQRGAWRIPTQELLAAGLRPRQARLPDQAQKAEPSSRPTAGPPGADQVRELEHALELERTRRRAVEDLAAERTHTIQTLESALRALQAHPAAPASNPDRAAPPPVPPSGATDTAGPVLRPGLCRWCRGGGPPSVTSARRRRRPSSDARSAANGHPSGAGHNSAVDLPV